MSRLSRLWIVTTFCNCHQRDWKGLPDSVSGLWFSSLVPLLRLIPSRVVQLLFLSLLPLLDQCVTGFVTVVDVGSLLDPELIYAT